MKHTKKKIEENKKATVLYLGEEQTFKEKLKSIFHDETRKNIQRKEIQQHITEAISKIGLDSSEQVLKIIINSLLFQGIPARSIMIDDSQVVHLDISSDLRTVVTTVLSCGHSRIPITSKDKSGHIMVSGLLHVKELLGFILKKPRAFSLSKLLHQPFVIPDTFPIDRLLEEFKERKIHIAIVVNEWGDFVGLITLEDVIEEVFGDFQDEFDKDQNLFIKRADGGFEADAKFSIRDLNKELELDITELSHQTIGGYIWHKLGSRPKVNDYIIVKGYQFIVKSLRGKTIGTIWIKPYSKK